MDDGPTGVAPMGSGPAGGGATSDGPAGGGATSDGPAGGALMGAAVGATGVYMATGAMAGDPHGPQPAGAPGAAPSAAPAAGTGVPGGKTADGCRVCVRGRVP